MSTCGYNTKGDTTADIYCYCNGTHGAKEVEGRLILPKGKGIDD